MKAQLFNVWTAWGQFVLAGLLGATAMFVLNAPSPAGSRGLLWPTFFARNTNVPFDERLWAAMGHEAWYLEYGYVQSPPTAQATFSTGTLGPTKTLATPAAASVSAAGAYLPLVFHEYAAPTATLTPSHTPTATPTRPPPPSVEARALWITRFDWTCILPCSLPGPDTVHQMVDNAATAGFNMLLFQIRGNGDAYYTPGLEPWSSRLTGTYSATLGLNPGWDPLAVMIAEAHARGMQVHAYFNAYPAWLTDPGSSSPPPDNTAPLHPFWTWSRAPGSNWAYWRQWDTSHHPMNLARDSYLWASPGNDWLVENHIVATAIDILSRYNVDGLHLDLVRYAGPNYSCDPRSEERWGGPCPTSIPDTSYADWQRSQVTRLVSRIYNEGVLPQGRRVMLSAAVWWFPQDVWGLGCNGGYDRYYQDAHGWLNAGIIDAEMPMLYGCPAFADGAAGDSNWAMVTQDWLAHCADRFVFPGISADMSFASIETRINSERAHAASVGAVAGHAIFCYSAVNARGYWDAFASGPYVQRAAAPTPGWHP